MDDNRDPNKPPEVPKTPSLPDVESPPVEEVLEGAPSVDEIIKRARPAGEIIDEQPSGDELTGRDRGSRDDDASA